MTSPASDPTAPPEQRKDNRGFDPKKRLKYFLIRSILFILGKSFAVLPEKSAYTICVGITLMAYRRLPKFKNLARRHLEIAFGKEKSPEEIEAILKQTYINYGKNLAEWLMLPYKTREWIESRVTFNDPHWRIRTALEQGKGVVGLGAHFGSWEIVGARLGIYHYPLAVIVRAQRDALMSRIIMDTRTKWGNEYIFKTRGIREECRRQLAMNKILALMADQNASRNGVFVDFFGKKAATVTGPAETAMLTGAPIIPSFPARNPDDTVTLYVLDPVPVRDTGDFQADLLHTTQLCAKVIEDFAREHPTEYFWWHKRWATRPPEEAAEKAK